VAWQRDLRAWPRLGVAPDADPFVSIYASGVLRGCYGSSEGPPGERIARAFLLAASDARFPLVTSQERRDVVAQLSYPIRARRCAPAELIPAIEIGTHGLAVALADGRCTAVLPDVACQHGLTASRFVAAARAKLGLPEGEPSDAETYFTFDTEVVSSERRSTRSEADACTLGLDWLRRQVEADGSIRFGVNARGGEPLPRGTMFHGRAATVIEALAISDRAPAVVRRARAWLSREVADALNGQRTTDWPQTVPQVAGTLALAIRAGVDVCERLTGLARSTPELAASPWHAAQVVAALGPVAPKELWQACVRDLDRNDVVPWTLLAARRFGDHGVQAECERRLVRAIRSAAPHRGAVYGAHVPEIALTAMCVTALRDSREPAARAAVGRGRAFLTRWQYRSDNAPVYVDPHTAIGAFPLSPVHHVLRSDVTAHAALALRA
jgi:AMMECR1 domain-containing protein